MIAGAVETASSGLIWSWLVSHLRHNGERADTYHRETGSATNASGIPGSGTSPPGHRAAGRRAHPDRTGGGLPRGGQRVRGRIAQTAQLTQRYLVLLPPVREMRTVGGGLPGPRDRGLQQHRADAATLVPAAETDANAMNKSYATLQRLLTSPGDAGLAPGLAAGWRALSPRRTASVRFWPGGRRRHRRRSWRRRRRRPRPTSMQRLRPADDDHQSRRPPRPSRRTRPPTAPGSISCGPSPSASPSPAP